MDDTTVSTKKKLVSKILTNKTEKTSEKKKKASKVPTIDLEPTDDLEAEPIPDQGSPVKSKKKAPKVPAIDLEPTDGLEAEPIPDQGSPLKSKKKAPKVPAIDLEPTDGLEAEPIPDQEAPVKSKKKRTPKIEINDDGIPIEEPKKKKKSKVPKSPSIDHDGVQMDDTPTIEDLETPVEKKSKSKKSKKSKKTTSKSLEDLQATNLDENDPSNLENNVNYTQPIDELPASDKDRSEYERAILDAYSNLASKVNFADYVGQDQWCILHLPKTARTEAKSRLRKMLPGGSKEEKSAAKPSVPKGSLFSRIRFSVNSLVRDENNLLFGEYPEYDMTQMDDDEDGVDTDDLHRYAQKLRELEDQDREVNPEFLVLRDGKTVYGVHESDADGKVKLSTRKPIYDRQADQKPDEQTTRKTIMSRLKMPFTRSKDKDEKNSKSENSTPDAHTRHNRKSSRKSLSDDLATTTTTIDDDPLKI